MVTLVVPCREREREREIEREKTEGELQNQTWNENVCGLNFVWRETETKTEQGHEHGYFLGLNWVVQETCVKTSPMTCWTLIKSQMSKSQI